MPLDPCNPLHFTVTGIPFAALASTHPAIASRMFAIASSSVFPCETHPGIAGHSATIIPVSSRSHVTINFISCS